MDSKPSLIIDPHSEAPKELSFPINEEGFKTFIKTLLGRPQEISRTIIGLFEINREDINHIHQAISQRIHQQNKSCLIQFSARMVFQDNSTTLLGSFEEFMTYNEIRPVLSTEIHLIWSYLITFQDKTTPEKQEIQVSIITAQSDRRPISKQVLSFDEEKPGFLEIHPNRVELRILHTARTWGADIEAMLTSLIRGLLKKPNSTKKFLRNHAGKISLMTFGFLVSLVCLSCCIVTRMILARESSTVSRLLDSKPVQDFAAVNDNIKKAVIGFTHITGDWYYYNMILSGYLALGILLAMIFSFRTLLKCIQPEESFLLLTSKSQDYLEHRREIEREETRSFFWNQSTALIVNVIASFVYWFLSRWMGIQS